MKDAYGSGSRSPGIGYEINRIPPVFGIFFILCSGCGATIYRGHALTELRGNSFTCDPTGNLVHREVLTPAGASFTGQPARQGVEFLASTDEWFRPVNLENGPDGALYVVDMYRAVIEHPQWVPEELKRRPDERHGDDCARDQEQHRQ